ncbi:glycosyltransferase family 4 protein [Photobacterium damselae]|uniref:glycosyltransferase family 4 protein n=1 Tax=Photobacterium damselae TaxID=38293 RepID=UPI00165E488B|nr:glycosyltransferase [Photobacterium damselae]
MKNILIISEAFWSPSKGTARYTMSLINELKHLTNVHLLVPKFNDSSDFKIEDIILHTVDIDIDSGVGLLDKKSRNDFISYVRANIKPLCKDNNIELIHITYGHFVIKSIPNDIDLPVLWTCHNMPPNESHPPCSKTNLLAIFINKLYRIAVRLKHTYLINTSKIDEVIAISEKTKIDIKRWLLKKDIHIIGNGCDFDINKNVEKNFNELKIITVGGIKPHKNVHIIPKISEKLNEYNICHSWKIIGPEVNLDYVKLLKDNISKYECTVEFLGSVKDSELVEYYKNSNLYVHLSKEEGFCLTILEAASFGAMTVSTNVGAIPDIISNLKNGILCESSSRSILSAIIKLFNATEYYNSGDYLSTLVSNNWSWKEVAKEHLEFYKKFD